MSNFLLQNALFSNSGIVPFYGRSRNTGNAGASSLFSSDAMSLLQLFLGGGVRGGANNRAPSMDMLLSSLFGLQDWSQSSQDWGQPQTRRQSQDYDYYSQDYDYSQEYDYPQTIRAPRSQVVANRRPVAPPPPPQIDPEEERLRAKALEMINDTKLSEDVLNGIIKKGDGDSRSAIATGNADTLNGAAQHWDLVNLAYDWGISAADGGIIHKGNLAGKTNNTVTTKDIADQLTDWDLVELNGEFGDEFGEVMTQKHKQELLNLKATIDKNLPWEATPFCMSQCQKFVDMSRSITSYVSNNECSNDTELRELAEKLHHRAGLYYQLAMTTQSPIVLDQDGNGKIDLTSIKDGVQFDIDGDGQKEQVAWTEAKGEQTDGWLALPDEEGDIKSGKQLFGNQWGDANGYERLKQFDDNQDGVIDAKDAIAGKLRMWQDKNHDGKVDAGEMKTLADAGVQSIQLGYTESDETDVFGNELRQQSNFTRTEAKAKEIANTQGTSFEQALRGLAVDAWVRTVK
jgi:hypothetical protein